jgi:hypothetical protein
MPAAAAEMEPQATVNEAGAYRLHVAILAWLRAVGECGSDPFGRANRP